MKIDRVTKLHKTDSSNRNARKLMTSAALLESRKRISLWLFFFFFSFAFSSAGKIPGEKMFKRKAPNCINLFRFVRNEMQEPVQRWKRVWALGSLFNSTKSLLMGNNLLQAIKGLLVSINVFYPSMSYYFNVYVHTCIHTHIYIYICISIFVYLYITSGS